MSLTADWAGTSHAPMFWNGRVYFLSDRDGVMNVYSMDANGHDLKQHTHQHGFDVQSASISDGQIVYQCGADLWLLDLKSGKDAIVPITLVSDFDQLRDHWVKKPLEYLTGVTHRADGSAAVFTARGEVFTLPPKSGRIVKVAGNSGVRYREALYMPDGKSIIALSTETGETEFWKYPANGVGAAEQWTNDAKVLRWEGVPSPDGHWLAHRDKDQQLWLLRSAHEAAEEDRAIDARGFLRTDVGRRTASGWPTWRRAANTFPQIKVLNANTGAIEALTSDRYNSESPAWSADGKWLYFLSDRMLKTTVGSPWGPRQPDPNFDRVDEGVRAGADAGIAFAISCRRMNCIPIRQRARTRRSKDEKTKTEDKGQDRRRQSRTRRPTRKAMTRRTTRAATPKKPPVKVNIDFANLACAAERSAGAAGKLRLPAGHGKAIVLDGRERRASAEDDAAMRGHREQGRRARHGDGRRQGLRNLRGPQEDAGRQGRRFLHPRCPTSRARR